MIYLSCDYSTLHLSPRVPTRIISPVGGLSRGAAEISPLPNTLSAPTSKSPGTLLAGARPAKASGFWRAAGNPLPEIMDRIFGSRLIVQLEGNDTYLGTVIEQNEEIRMRLRGLR